MCTVLNVCVFYTLHTYIVRVYKFSPLYAVARVKSLSCSVQSGRKIDFAVHPLKKIEFVVVGRRERERNRVT